MKTIVVSDDIYGEILKLKNMVAMETNRITNPEVRKQLQIPSKGSWLIREELFDNIMDEKDFQPELTLEKFLQKVVHTVWEEQETERLIRFEDWR